MNTFVIIIRLLIMVSIGGHVYIVNSHEGLSIRIAMVGMVVALILIFSELPNVKLK